MEFDPQKCKLIFNTRISGFYKSYVTLLLQYPF